MPLPTVLMTDVIRSTQQGDSHGGAYLIDLERGTHEQVLDWNEVGIDWEGRGAGRGLRGIVFHGEDIYIAASDELYVFDRSFNIQRSFKNPYLHHCHEIFLEGDRIYLTSTTYSSILEFNIAEGRFDRGVCIQPDRDREQKGMRRGTVQVYAFDPESNNGPEEDPRLHINSVWRHNNATFLSGLYINSLVAIDDQLRLAAFAPLPLGTHNARPHGAGLLYNSTAQDAIVFADRRGNPVWHRPVPKYPENRLVQTDIPEDYARQGFGRGLCVSTDGTVIGSSSPSTVTAFNPTQRGILATVNVTKDVRNCPHGLEIWPY